MALFERRPAGRAERHALRRSAGLRPARLRVVRAGLRAPVRGRRVRRLSARRASWFWARCLVGALFFALQAIEFEAGDGDAGIGAMDFFGGAAQIVIERDGFFFAAPAATGGAVRVRLRARPFRAARLPGARPSAPERSCSFKLRGVFAQFALQHQRTAGFLASAGEHAAVIALAVGEQEVAVGMGVRHGARLIAIGREVTAARAAAAGCASGRKGRW